MACRKDYTSFRYPQIYLHLPRISVLPSDACHWPRLILTAIFTGHAYFGHACQTSDAEGTIRVLQTLLAKGGQAHFVVAHPRTRFGVDALVPLLEKSPGLEFTCEEVEDPELVEGIEEAAYLAWLHVHVWWGDGEDTPLLGVEKAGARDMEGLLVAG